MVKLWKLGREWCSYPDRRHERGKFLILCLMTLGVHRILGLQTGLDMILLVAFFLFGIHHNIREPEGFVTQMALPREKRVFYSLYGGMLKTAVWFVLLLFLTVAAMYLLLGLVLGMPVTWIMSQISWSVPGEQIDYAILFGILELLMTLLFYVLSYPLCFLKEEEFTIFGVLGGAVVLRGIRMAQDAMKVTKSFSTELTVGTMTDLAERQVEVIRGIGFWVIGLAVLVAVLSYGAYRLSVWLYDRMAREGV